MFGRRDPSGGFIRRERDFRSLLLPLLNPLRVATPPKKTCNEKSDQV